MRILWLSHMVPYPPKGGSLQRSHNLLKQAARRHDVHLVALNQRGLLPREEQVAEAVAALEGECAAITVFPTSSDRTRAHRAALIGSTFFRAAPYDVNWLYNPRVRRHLEALADTESFDLVHVDTVGLIGYAAPFRGVPVVLNHHNIESQMMRRRASKERSRLKSLYFRREAPKLEALERRVCPSVALNVVVSALDGERLRAIAPGVRIAVVDNGVDIDYFRPRPETVRNPNRLVFAGGMNWYPNREAMLFFLREIWPGLAAANPATRATIVGQDPPREVLAASADPRIAVPGFVDDVRPTIDAAGIYVCPIRDGGGTRLKILDALAMAKPLVATALAVEGFDLVPERHYLGAETPEEFITQIRRLQEDAGLCERLGRAGRRFVEERFAWDRLGAKLDAAYREAAGPPAVSPGPDGRRGAKTTLEPA